jgi:pyruvate, water dikinase
VSAVLVRRLAEVGSADAALVGGKAAGLGELTRAGIAVPAGYVVLAGAFGDVMAAADPSGALARSVADLPVGDLTGVAARLREVIRALPLPADLAAQITVAYESLSASGVASGVVSGEAFGEAFDEALGEAAVPVAVRSSATLEDSPAASFAGLQDTYLAVRGADAVLDAVRRCWASLYNDESVAYRRRMGLTEDGLAMGVVIQRMLHPRAAGVMFTRSPVTGDRSVVAIEGTWGLGSALVAGEVTPDCLVVSKVTGEITGRRIGAKLRWHSFGPNEPGISSSAVPDSLRGRPCLTDDEARALACVGRRVEEHYGVPQDIEWALLGEQPGSGPWEPPDSRPGEPPGARPGEPPGARPGEPPGARPEGDSALLGEPADRIRLLQSRPETVWAARERPPVATPRPRASDHVLAWLEKPL